MQILRSIISPSSIAETVLQNYDISLKNIKCKLLKAGGSNDVYLIKDSHAQFIIKLYSDRRCWPYTHETFLLEATMMHFLHKNNVSVPQPISNLHNSFVTTVQTPEYDKYCILSTYVEGTHHNNGRPDYQRLFVLGQALAFLHNSSTNFKYLGQFERKIDMNFLLHQPRNRIDGLANVSKRLLLQLNRLYEELVNALITLNHNDLTLGIIHGDMHSGNHKYIKSSHRISFLDFELCGLGWRVYDLAVFRWNLYFAHPVKLRKVIWSSFLSGYLSINTLTTTEHDAIVLFMKIRHFFFLGSTAIVYPEAVAYNNTKCISNKYNMIDEFEIL